MVGWRRWAGVWAILLACGAGVRAGTVGTRSGEVVEGRVTLAEGKVEVAIGGEKSRVFELSEVSSAKLRSRRGAGGSYVSARNEKAKERQRRVLAEYFSDAEMTERVLARYEPAAHGYWANDERPEVGMPAVRAVRYTARLVPEYSEQYTLTAESAAGLRLWIDGELRMDSWVEKPETKLSSHVKVRAKEPVLIRFEARAGKHNFHADVQWRSRSKEDPWIAPEAYAKLEGVNEAPVVSIVSPEDEAEFVAPDSIVIDVAASDKHDISRVELFRGKESMGVVETPPFRFTWDRPPAGYHKLMAKATDGKGVSGYSPAVDLPVGDRGEGDSLRAGWGAMTLSNGRKPEMGEREPAVGVAAYDAKAGAFTITRAGGQVTEGDDAACFVYRVVKGDFEVVARLASLEPRDNIVGALAGVMVRESMHRDARLAGVMVNPQHVSFVRRTESWSKVAGTERAVDGAGPPTWLKLRRHGSRVRAFVSADGKAWEALGNEKVELPERVFVGVCGMSRNKEVPATAVFDAVAISPGPPGMIFSEPGILYRSGTFLAAEVLGVKENQVIYNRGGKKHYDPATEVARVVYNAVPQDVSEQAPEDRSGVLLASGDFVEGEVKEVSHRVAVSNVVFGLRSFNTRGKEVLAVYLKEPEGEAGPYSVVTMDGSVYRGKELRLGAAGVAIQDAVLGKREIPGAEVAEIRVK